MKSKKLALLIVFTCCFRLMGLAQTTAQGYFQQQVDYTIDVTLNDPDRSLDGFVRMIYTNNSTDTLPYLWIHCWPNAYKNDRTAFSEQLLGNGRTDFYFSDKDKRGYINRLAFTVDGQTARTEDHPLYIDVLKLILPRPLPPGGRIAVATPFHEKLPYNFSRGGWTLVPTGPAPHKGAPVPTAATYQVTQWYPKPAVYDRKGWHPMPYLDQGQFYSEFGSFDVRITVPNYLMVAAGGQPLDTTRPSAKTKTLHYKQNRIDDFAWFADRRFHVGQDTLRLPSGRIVNVYSYYTPDASKDWKGSIGFIKDAIRFHSNLIGEYPYNTITAVQTKTASAGGMEYPTLAVISSAASARDIDLAIAHEVGRNWFGGVLAANERRYPWMDEGVDRYYDKRYAAAKYPAIRDASLPLMYTLAVQKKDQPVSTPSADFTQENYFTGGSTKAAGWMKMLEDSLGTVSFDRCMKQYFLEWQFKHPYPEDFRRSIATTSHRPLDTLFGLLDRKGALPPLPAHRKIKPVPLFSLKHPDKYNYIGISPVVGYNVYDHLMAGLLIHNLNLPPNPIQFYLAPMYAAASRQLNGAGGIIATIYPDRGIQKLRLSVGFQRFSTVDATDSNRQIITGGYYKITPGLRIVFPKAFPRSTLEKSLEWKTYLIGEKNLDHYALKTSDTMYYPVPGKYDFRYLNELSFDIRDTRAVYPYDARVQLQQAANWYRVNLKADYFFNYDKGGGLDIRIFGSKFGYLGAHSSSADFSRYEPKLTALRGSEDYTYDNFFIGRNEFSGAASQQILLRDGDLKLRTDLFQSLQGRSDNWVASINLRSTLPRAIAPAWFPLRLFFDAGTYAGAWDNNPPTSHFLYVGGFELSFFHDVVRIFMPLVSGNDFSSQLKTVPDQNTFWKKLSFSIDLRNIDARKIGGISPF